MFKMLIEIAINNKIPFGFDSCAANSFLKDIKGMSNYSKLAEMADPCES